MKLEFGSYQTLGRYENNAWVLNEIPDFGEELMKCQRYYFPIPNVTRYNATYRSAANIDFLITTPVAMANTPQLIAPNFKILCAVDGSATLQEQTGFTFTNTPLNTIRNGTEIIRANKSGHGIIMSPCILFQPGADAYFTSE